MTETTVDSKSLCDRITECHKRYIGAKDAADAARDEARRWESEARALLETLKEAEKELAKHLKPGTDLGTQIL